ncbi:MAG: hypothetical protein PF508_19030 [Spirochaeta sp.]|jgi:hypothetical protein|nr:hypothetical protein [Spirochaeta sp.]
MSNKRQVPRRDTVLYLQVVHAVSGEPIGRVADISKTGLLLIAGNELTPGVQLPVRIQLPPAISADGESLVGTIEPRWHRRDLNPRLTLNGCLFTVSEGADHLDELIERYGFNNDTIDFRKRFERSKREPDEES